MKSVIKILTISILLFGCLSCGCTKNRVLPNVDPNSFDRYVQDLTLSSKLLGKEIKYSVYLPKTYVAEKNKRYPVVFMCHGYGDDNNSWHDSISSIDIAESNGAGEMIYVFPQAFNSYYCNRYDGSFNYMDMFVKELIPHVDKTLRTIPDKVHRFICGYSMGGFGAMVLAMKHPELFCASAPLSMSFRTDEMYISEPKDGWNSQWGSIFGGYDATGPSRLTQYYKEHCPLYQFNVGNNSELNSVHWYLTCGDDEERLLIANDTLHVLMRDNGYRHEFRVADGGHTSSYWRSALLEVIPMFWYYSEGGENWPGINMDLPQIKEAKFEQDGSLHSDSYVSSGGGTTIFVFHQGLEDTLVRKEMLILLSNLSGSNSILLPCDLTEKGVQEWEDSWSVNYLSNKKIAVGLSTAGVALFEKKADFAKCILVNAPVLDGEKNIVLSSEDNLSFVCTDDFPWYTDMDRLYHASKKYGSKYEYRVLNSSGNEESDLLRCTETAKYFTIN